MFVLGNLQMLSVVELGASARNSKRNFTNLEYDIND